MLPLHGRPEVYFWLLLYSNIGKNYKFHVLNALFQLRNKQYQQLESNRLVLAKEKIVYFKTPDCSFYSSDEERQNNLDYEKNTIVIPDGHFMSNVKQE